MFDEMLIINISVKYQLTEYDGYQTYFQELIIPGNDNRCVKFIRICEIPLFVHTSGASAENGVVYGERVDGGNEGEYFVCS